MKRKERNLTVISVLMEPNLFTVFPNGLRYMSNMRGNKMEARRIPQERSQGEDEHLLITILWDLPATKEQS